MHIGPGEIFSLLSAMTWAVGVILYRQLVRDLPALTLNFNKNLLVLVMLLPLPWILHGTASPAMPWHEALLAMASGFLGIAVADTLYFVALARLGAGRMGVIGNAYSPIVIILSMLWLGERLNRWQIIGFLLVTAGVLVIAQRPRPARVVVGAPVPPPDPPPANATAAPAAEYSHTLSILTGVAAIVLMAVAIVMIKPILETRLLGWVTLLRLLGAIIGLVLIAALRGQMHQLRARGRKIDWKLLAIAAFFGQCLSMVLWLAGYKYAPASIAAVLNETASIFILLLAWWWLREPLGRRGVFGVMLTLPGVALMLLR